jgi:8-oxo-dGTP pyrophosphatase MutT (NUDIX family)
MALCPPGLPVTVDTINLARLRRAFAAPPTDFLPPEAIERESQFQGEDDIRPAAVLMPLIDRPEGLTVLFTRRTAHLRSHAGQISFPGGRCEPSDPTPAATALRETREEIGLPDSHIEVLGFLPSQYTTRSGFIVTPVVGAVRTPFALQPDDSEVAEVFEVPLAFLLDPSNHREGGIVADGETRRFHAIPYGDRYIWGVTAGILMHFYWFLSAAEHS